MTFWIVFICIICGIYLWATVVQPRYVYVGEYFITFFLIFIAGFRYMIGWDYATYMELYNRVEIDDVFIEKSFSLLAIFLRENGFDFQMMFLIYSFFTIIFFWLGCKYYTINKLTCLILYAFLPLGYMNSMGVIRQALAISIVFWGTKFICSKNFKMYIVSILMAASVHISAVFMIICYPVMRRKYSLKYHIAIVFLCSIVAYFDFMGYVIGSVFEFFDIPYMRYLLSGLDQKPSMGNLVFYMGTWLVILLIMYINKVAIGNEHKTSLVMNMCTATPVMILVFFFSYELIRIKDFFSIFYIVGLVYCIDSFKSLKWKMLIKGGVIILSLCYFFLYLHNIEANVDGNLHGNLSANNIDYDFNFKLFQ